MASQPLTESWPHGPDAPGDSRAQQVQPSRALSSRLSESDAARSGIVDEPATVRAVLRSQEFVFARGLTAHPVDSGSAHVDGTGDRWEEPEPPRPCGLARGIADARPRHRRRSRGPCRFAQDVGRVRPELARGLFSIMRLLAGGRPATLRSRGAGLRIVRNQDSGCGSGRCWGRNPHPMPTRASKIPATSRPSRSVRMRFSRIRIREDFAHVGLRHGRHQ